MRVTYIAAGAGGSHCGACARDVALVRSLLARGHDVLLVPVYTPLHTEGPDPSLPRVFYGGISVYLQQQLALFRKMPRFISWLLDRPALLRMVSRHAIETQPEGLGPMTVSVLRGRDGFQRQALENVLRFLETQARPDVVNLTNSLLSSLAAPIKDRLHVPVACTLQGEDAFVMRLPEPYASEAQGLMRENARHIAIFMAPGEAYAEEMSKFLAVTRSRVRVIRPGIDLAPFSAPSVRVREPFRVGYLSRVSPAKGLDVLVEAFCALDSPSDAVLAVAGQLAPRNRRFWQQQRERLASAGLARCLDYAGAPDLQAKARFLQQCSVFCLPARYAESNGIAAIEAMASGVPVILPDRGVFPELVALTGGGMLVPPDDASALAEALDGLRHDPDEADELGRAGRAGAARHFSADAMATHTLEAYEQVLERYG